MLLRFFISLLLTLGFADATLATQNSVSIEPEYKTEWVHKAPDGKSAHPFYWHTHHLKSVTVQVYLSEQLYHQLDHSAFRQQSLKYLPKDRKQGAIIPTYPSEDPLYCLQAS